jgi:LEA14-like dessication related protein
MAEILEVKAGDNFLKSIFNNVKNPSRAICELIWNSLDADAVTIRVDFKKNSLGGIVGITIKDDGHGIKEDELKDAFEYIGKSLKTFKDKSPAGRTYHGYKGQGRYFAFALGLAVEWQSTYKKDNKLFTFSITGQASSSRGGLTHFQVTDIEEMESKTTGVTVNIDNLTKICKNIDIDSLTNDIITEFAYYLKAYEKNNISIYVDDVQIDTQSAIIESKEKTFTLVKQKSGEKVEFKLAMYHWKNKSIKRRYFCGTDGTVITEDSKTGIIARDFGHSIYIASEYLDKLHKENISGLFEADGIYPDLEEKVDLFLSDFLRSRLAERAKSILGGLKGSGIYPYKSEPENTSERVEREMFDIYASHILTSSHEPMGSTKQSKALVLNLLKDAMEKDPVSIIPIFKEVLELPSGELETLAKLVKNYTLSSIIKISRLITDRIAFLNELRELLFDNELKNMVLERKHLHKIIEREIWLFGEQYLLGTSDKSLENVLKEHVKLLGRDDLIETDGSTDLNTIPDLFLYRLRPEGEGQSEHLIIELKRPSLKLGRTEFNQIQDYAEKVAGCPDFDKKKVRWKFILIGNSMDSHVNAVCNQKDRPNGLAIKPENENYEVYVYTWGEILQSLTVNYAFIKQKIDNLEGAPEDLRYIRENYSKFLPSEKLADDKQTKRKSNKGTNKKT